MSLSIGTRLNAAGEEGRRRIDHSKKSPHHRQRADKNSKDGKMAKKKADQKQRQKTTVKEGKKHKMHATADNGKQPHGMTAGKQANKANDKVPRSKKKQENPQPKKTDESKRNSVTVRRLTRPYARKTACLDVTGSPCTVAVVDTIDDAKSLMFLVSGSIRYEYNGKELRILATTKSVANAVRVVGWNVADREVTDRHAAIRFVVMMQNPHTGGMLRDEQITEKSLRNARPTLTACLVTHDDVPGSQQHDGTVLHMLCERRMSQVPMPLKPSVARTTLVPTSGHMSAENAIVGITEFADAVNKAIAMCAIRIRGVAKATSKEATATSCLDVTVSVDGMKGSFALNKALCLMKQRQAGELPFDAYGQRIAGAFVSKGRWYVTYAPTALDTFQPYFATIDHVMPQRTPSSVDALCNMALMTQASNMRKDGAIIGTRLPNEPIASMNVLKWMLMGLRYVGKQNLDKDTLDMVSESYAYEALECLKYLYRPCGLKKDWVTPVRKTAATKRHGK